MSSVTIGDGVTSIGQEAFYGCSSLLSLTMGDGIVSIGEGTFYNCSSLTSINIPDGVISIGEYAFYNCSSLKSVYMTDLSAWCKLVFVSSYSSPLCYGAKLYMNDQELIELVIPEGITRINDAFSGCSSLASVTIGDDVVSIGSDAFSGCSSLASVTIGDGVISIGLDAFSDCSSLASVTMGDGVVSIGVDAFSGCSSLASVTIGDGVIAIDEDAFSGCFSLKDFYCYAATPPSICYNYGYSFPKKGYDVKTILHVPKECVTEYQSSDWASYFKTIVEME